MDQFCGVCGQRQTPAGTGTPGTPGARGPQRDPLSGITSRNASLLCYIPYVGWIAAIIVLASSRFRYDSEVRFNAFQGLYLFVIWLIVDWVISPLLLFPMHFGVRMALPQLLKVAVLGVWIFMLVKVSQGQSYRLPILGELADRSVTEQH